MFQTVGHEAIEVIAQAMQLVWCACVRVLMLSVITNIRCSAVPPYDSLLGSRA